MAKNKNYDFCAYHSFGNSQSCITAVKWDAYDVKNTAGINGKIDGRDNADLEGNFEKILKNQIEIF